MTTVPPALIAHLGSSSRTEVLEHRNLIQTQWWTPHLEPLGYSIRTDPEGYISRSDLFALAEDPDSLDVLDLLWHVLAWTSGTNPRLNIKRVQAVAKDREKAEAVLLTGVKMSRQAAIDGFLAMQPKKVPFLQHLSLPFFTRYLYFAGAGNPRHPCLILDENVLATLFAATGEGRYHSSEAVGPKTYQGAVEIMRWWADEATDETGRLVSADEVEKWASTVAGNL